MKKIAVFAGTFDPPHFGHLDVVEKASEIFDLVIWAVADNSSKNPMFSLDERMDIMAKMKAERLDNYGLPIIIRALQPNQFLVDFARENKARFLVRSFRLTADFEYELQLSLINKKLAPEIQTVFIPPEQEHLHISSSIVREFIKSRHNTDELTTEYLCNTFGDRYGRR
jgi:pantetheine-phosphate adenylyltransferase